MLAMMLVFAAPAMAQMTGTRVNATGGAATSNITTSGSCQLILSNVSGGDAAAFIKQGTNIRGTQTLSATVNQQDNVTITARDVTQCVSIFLWW